ncbi:MAG: excisionase family DNA-binding protein [Dehalococcoidia bacterium]
MTIREAAAELGVTPRALQLRIKNGEMRAERIGSFLLIPRAEVERWKEIGKRKGGRPRKAKDATEDQQG